MLYGAPCGTKDANGNSGDEGSCGRPALKRCDDGEASFEALKRFFPRMNAGAPSEKLGSLRKAWLPPERLRLAPKS